MIVPYNYEMVSNSTKMSNNDLGLSDLVLDVEYAITDMLLKTLFTECTAYYQKSQGMKKKLRQLIAGQVIGISSQPNDIITEGKYKRFFSFYTFSSVCEKVYGITLSLF